VVLLFLLKFGILRCCEPARTDTERHRAGTERHRAGTERHGTGTERHGTGEDHLKFTANASQVKLKIKSV
jgi:hypothetical protein